MSTKRRPPRADALRNREHLLGIAREVFAAAGLEAPIDDVARRAGLGIGTVYRHFPNKEALFEAIVLDQLDHLLAEGDALERQADPEQTLVQFLEKYMAAGAAKKDFVAALARGRSGAQPPPAIRKSFKLIRETVGRLLSRAQNAGVIRSDIGVDETLALLHGVSAAGTSYEGRPEGRSQLWTVVLDGLRASRSKVKK